MLAGAILDPRYALFTLFAIGLAGIFLFPSDLDVVPGCGEHGVGLTLFDSKPEAAEFIRTLWQVEGAVLALSITVIVFAFQAIGSSRYGASLHEFAQDTNIYPVFYWGIVGLVIDGLVLLGLSAKSRSRLRRSSAMPSILPPGPVGASKFRVSKLGINWL